MKKIYTTPTLRTEALMLGVFGDYGQDGGDNNHPGPVKVIDFLDMHQD